MCSYTGSLRKLPVKRNKQPFWSKHFNALTINLTVTYMPWSQQTFLVFQDVFKTSWRRLQRNTFRLPRPLEDVFKTYLRCVFLKRLQDVFKTSWKTKKWETEDVFSTSSPRRMFAGICLQTKKHFRSSILSESTGLFWLFSFHVLGYGRNWFVIYKNLSSFSLIYVFRNGLVFLWCFSKLLTLRQSKNWPNIWQYLVVWEVSLVSKVWYTCWLIRFSNNFNDLSRSSL